MVVVWILDTNRTQLETHSGHWIYSIKFNLFDEFHDDIVDDDQRDILIGTRCH